jgi:hypothetical protein
MCALARTAAHTSGGCRCPDVRLPVSGRTRRPAHGRAAPDRAA